MVCHVSETREHVLMSCRQCEEQRKILMGELGKVGLTGTGMKEILEGGENEQSSCRRSFCSFFIKDRIDEENMIKWTFEENKPGRWQ